MESGDMLKQLLEKFTVDESVIQEELKLVLEQIEQLEGRLEECSARRESLQSDREKVMGMMQRYVHGKFEPPPEVLSRLDSIASTALAAIDGPANASSAAKPSERSSATPPLVPTPPVAPVPPSPPVEPVRPVPQPEPEAYMPPPVVEEPLVEAPPSRVQSASARRKQFEEALAATPEVSEEVEDLSQWEVEAPVVEEDEVPSPIPPPLEPVPPTAPVAVEPPPQPVAPIQPDTAAASQPAAAAAPAPADENAASTVDFGGEEEADLKSINDALRSLFR